MRRFLRMLEHIYALIFRKKYKEAHELAYWRSRMEIEKKLVNDHYRFFYTDYFDLSPAFYNDKRILDIGCGPRGSLTWAVNAAERVGLDTLVDKYLAMGADQHNMQYVNAPAEAIPYVDRYFDVVCSFNSLDHVDSLNDAIKEIHRVLKDSGVFLLIVEINHSPTPTEPVEIRDLHGLFGALFEIRNQRKYEIGELHDIYGQIKANCRYDESDGTDRPAIMTAMLVKRGMQ